jgi:ADP-L-glycero-D-manno-heptose 6-epimerase
VSGIFNVGTGEPRSFRDLVTALFNAVGRTPDITYVDMPEAFRDRYQYFTRAEMDRLRGAGFNAGFTPLEAAVKDYATRFLAQPDRYR